ncbi:helix-turn-helix domain-containing protein [Candidatus Ruminimicrobium bovinum]|uniref:helix-turn-helix domain-containing protein n=1 Tax=Candidatus Ruminimicrobium bovinum TaxID=3242779 RepID=UPI0039B8E344
MFKEDIYTTISKRIKEERKKLSLTQEEVACRAEIGTKFLSSIERNTSKPSLDTFIKIAKALNTSCDNLIRNTHNNSTIDDSIINSVKYLFSTLSKKQQKQIVDIIKSAIKLIK